MAKKRATKSVRKTRKVKSLSLSAKNAKGVKGGSFSWSRGANAGAGIREKWIT